MPQGDTSSITVKEVLLGKKSAESKAQDVEKTVSPDAGQVARGRNTFGRNCAEAPHAETAMNA